MRYVAFSLLTIICFEPTSSQVTNFYGRWRYGTISWTLVSGSSQKASVVINVESAWRLSDPSIVVSGTQTPISSAGQIFQAGPSNNQDSLLKFGDGTITGRINIQVLRVDTVQDLVVGRSTFQHDYPPGGTYNASLSLCCRVAGSQNGNGGVNLVTLLDLTAAAAAGPSPPPTGSPVFQTLPWIMLGPPPPGGAPQRFALPAVSQAGFARRAALRWRPAPAEYYGASDAALPPPAYGNFDPAAAARPGSSVDAVTGVVSVDTGCLRTLSCSDVHLVRAAGGGRGGG